ncbi:hypothetical protein BUALT_Bualt08G0115500 [Buddleja alternifolia]|uniref:Hpc2-related domain-containing protein n=1 Tax=Buddleja alternifolia TaxID=168488 RepID=A0AAV6X5L3_9LAMI|nr:hypothetical protein BUALT_Bualt08G0115500 [Buddleja alternifolia]
MVEGGGPESGPRSKPASSFESAGDRLRFTVEIRPGETTIVSWKKLLREANSSKPNGAGTSVSCPSSEANQQLVSQTLPPPPPPPTTSSSSKQQAEDEAKDSQAQPGSNRLSTVIERIERMYAGNGSSEEEDVFLDDVPDDDEYDTEDSFIDDAELLLIEFTAVQDDYFQVDNSAIKHDGFFVNRGKLERIEPTISTTQQPKKRRRKDVTKGRDGDDDGHNPNKHVKGGNKGRKASSSTERNSTTQSRRVTVPNVHSADMLSAASPTNAAEISVKKKTADTKIMVDPSGLLSGDGIRQDKDADQQKTGIPSSKNHSSKRKESGELQDTSSQRSNDKSSNVSKSHSGKQPSNADELDQTIQRKEKGGLVERFDLNVPASRDSSQITKVPPMPRKEGSNVRPKSSMLDKAIRELEKIVAESRPPSTEVQDPDNSSQAVKRRLTPEIKQKLGKVARLAAQFLGEATKLFVIFRVVAANQLWENTKGCAQSSDEHCRPLDATSHAKALLMQKQSKSDVYLILDVKIVIAGNDMAVGRFFVACDCLTIIPANNMCFLCQRNLKIMANMGLSAKQEKDDRLHKIKQEVAEMVTQRIPYIKSKVEQQTNNSDDFQEAVPEEKEALKRKYSMDDALENKICNLYDLYVERLEEDSGPPVRRLYEELAALWPSGFMDTDGIKRAIYKAKDRRRALFNRRKDQEKIRKKKALTPKAENTIQGEALNVNNEKNLSVSPNDKPTLSSAVSCEAVPFANIPKVDKPKQERVKGSSSSNPIDGMATDTLLPKKKVKRKPKVQTVESQFRLEKVEEKNKQHKHVAGPLPKSNIQPAAAAPSGSENPS